MALRTCIAAGGNWSNTATWGGQSVPTSADDVDCSALTGTLVVNSNGRSCRSITFGTCTGTLQMDFQIQVGNASVDGLSTFITLSPDMTITGSGQLLIQNNAGNSPTITSNGKEWPNTFTIPGAGAGTFTINGTFTTRNLTISNANSQTTINGSDFIITGDVTASALTTGSITGTSTIRFNTEGSATITGNAGLTTGRIINNLVLGGSGTRTWINRFGYGSTNTFTKTSGTDVTTGATLVLHGAATTTGVLDISAMTWPTIERRNTTAVTTLANHLFCSSLVDLGVTTIGTFNGSGHIKNSGGFTSTMTTGRITGTSTIEFTGSGTISTNSATTGGLGINILISGDYTAGSTLAFPGQTEGATLTVTGTLNTITNNTQLRLCGVAAVTSTLDVASVNWPTVELAGTGGPTVNLTSDLNITGNVTDSLRVTGALVFNGPGEINVGGGWAANSWSSGNITGTVKINFIGSGVIATNSVTSGGFGCDVEITTTNYTFGSRIGITREQFIYSGNSPITTAATLVVGGVANQTTTFDISNITWNKVEFRSSVGTTELLSNVNVDTLTFLNGNATRTVNGSRFNVSESIVADALVTGIIQGTTEIHLTGSEHTISMSSVTTGSINNKIIVDNESTITFDSICRFDNIETKEETTFAGHVKIGTFKFNKNIILSENTICDIATHLEGKNSNVFSPNGADLILQEGATQNLSRVNATNIDSSGGQTVRTYKGILNNTINWESFDLSRRSIFHSGLIEVG
jgi:hypothetical protein